MKHWNTVCFSLSSFYCVNVCSCHRTAVLSALGLAASLSGFSYDNIPGDFNIQKHLQHLWRGTNKDLKCLWYHDIKWCHHDTGIWTKINTTCSFLSFFFALPYNTQTDSEQQRQTQAVWTVTALPYRFMWLSNHHLTFSLLSMDAPHRQGNNNKSYINVRGTEDI